MADCLIKVGVDFGTTYSGIAWVHTSKREEMNIIRSWPHGGRRESDKVPSEIAYDKSFLPYGYKWGFEVESIENKIAWPKLLLDRTQERNIPSLTPILNRIRTKLPLGKKPVDVVADYLSGLERHLRETLIRRYGEGFMENTRMEYALTVPAVWSDGGKALTLEAAERAGLGSRGSIELIAEPEAAAVYSLPSMQPTCLKVGDIFVVADCGGGTVDVVSYKITQLSPTFQTKEYAVGGGLCGSTFINRSFEKFVEERKRIQFSTMSPKGCQHMFRAFDDLKKIVSEGDGERSYTIPAPGLEDNQGKGIEGGLLLLTKGEIKAIFDPVIDQVVRLIQDQVTTIELKKNGKALGILLVGGFGNSEYLREQLEKRIMSIASGCSIPIMRPTHSWTAVVRGAVLRSLESLSVTTRIVRNHYGISVSRRFISGVHQERDKEWCKYRLEWRCNNQVHWFINKGTEVGKDQEIRHRFHKYFSATYIPGVQHTTLYICARSSVPTSIRETSVTTLCILDSDLSNVPARHFKMRTNANGIQYKFMKYNLIMKIQSAQLVFSMEIDGIEYSNVKAKFV